MKNLENIGLGLEELSSDELKKVDGGFINLILAGIGLTIAAYSAGYMTGKAIF